MIKDRFSEIGKIREINKSTILNAAGLIKKGKIFDLGMEINENLPGREQGMFPFNIIFESTPEDIKKHLKNLDYSFLPVFFYPLSFFQNKSYTFCLLYATDYHLYGMIIT